jgi:uncharacterized membrane protein
MQLQTIQRFQKIQIKNTHTAQTQMKYVLSNVIQIIHEIAHQIHVNIIETVDDEVDEVAVDEVVDDEAVQRITTLIYPRIENLHPLANI